MQCRGTDKGDPDGGVTQPARDTDVNVLGSVPNSIMSASRTVFLRIIWACGRAIMLAADTATECRPRGQPHPSVLYSGAIISLNQARTPHFCDLILVQASRNAKLARLLSVVSLLGRLQCLS